MYVSVIIIEQDKLVDLMHISDVLASKNVSLKLPKCKLYLCNKYASWSRYQARPAEYQTLCDYRIHNSFTSAHQA